ncbi:MAG: PqqD family protein [Intestinibacter sp.]
MKINKNFMLRKIAGENLIVATGEASQIFNGMITLNDVATYIWENVDECGTVDMLVEKILTEFDIDEETARRDVIGFTSELIKIGMIEE